jgi:drug/metabolite transporter (DMT)-like permease
MHNPFAIRGVPTLESRIYNQYLEICLLVVLAFLWGSSFTFIKIAVETVPPATIVLGRLILGAGLLLLLVRLKGITLPTSPVLWGAFAIQGFLQSALPFTLISWGEKHIDSGLAGLLNSTPPLFAFLITFFILRRSEAPLRKFIGVAVGFLGVLMTLGPDVLNGSTESAWAQIAVTGSSISYAVAAIYARRFSTQPALLTAACSMVMAMLMMAPVAFVIDQPWALTPSKEALWSIAALGILSTTLAMVIYFRLVKTLGAVGVTSGSYLRAGFSVLLGVIFLGEAISINLVAGLVLILLSVAIVTGQIPFIFSRKKE